MSAPPAPLPGAFRDWEKEVSSCGPGGSSCKGARTTMRAKVRRVCWSVENHLEGRQDLEDATQMGHLFTTSFLFAESTVWKPLKNSQSKKSGDSLPLLVNERGIQHKTGRAKMGWDSRENYVTSNPPHLLTTPWHIKLLRPTLGFSEFVSVSLKKTYSEVALASVPLVI